MTTVAGGGAGAAAWADGPVAAAAFAGAAGLAADGAGGVLVADAFALRLLVPSRATVVTLAGGGAAGAADGWAAGFNRLVGAAVLSTGAVVLADVSASNNALLRGAACAYASASATPSPGAAPSTSATPTPTPSATPAAPPGPVCTSVALSGTIANAFADGPPATARYNVPCQAAFRADGAFVFADRWNQRVRLVFPNGTAATLCGSGAIGSGGGACAVASFNYPVGLVFDAAGSSIFVSNNFDSIRRLDFSVNASGWVTNWAGSAAQGYLDATGTNARFRGPDMLALDAAGNLYVRGPPRAKPSKACASSGFTKPIPPPPPPLLLPPSFRFAIRITIASAWSHPRAL